MIYIKIPNNNIPERKYIIDILFKEFLGLKYILEIGSQDYEIILPNKKKLIIEDTFFNKYPKDLEYLKEENIPKNIIELDIFSASFFMLTRWEEYVNKTRDIHNRFPAIESLAYKEGLLDRPIVNELLEEFKEKLLGLDDGLIFKKRVFSYILTHDIDVAQKYSSLKSGLREIFDDFFKRKNILLGFYHLWNKIVVHAHLKKDPFDTYDYLMDISERLGTKSYFFLHSSNQAKQDINNDKFLKKIVKKIRKRSHFLGYHPSYDAYNNHDIFRRDKQAIEEITNTKLEVGRQHYLKFEVPKTWQIWEDNGMVWDSTLGYADKEGFRCGVCYEYSVFNILTREKLRLKEKPLIVMDGSFASYQEGVSHKQMKNEILSLINTTKKYQGEFVFLWHNSSFNTQEWESYQDIYREVLWHAKN